MLELAALLVLILLARWARRYRQRLAFERENARVVERGAYRTLPGPPILDTPRTNPVKRSRVHAWFLRQWDLRAGVLWQTRVDPKHVWQLGWDGPPEPWIFDRVTFVRDWVNLTASVVVETFPVEDVPWWWRGHEVNVQHGAKWPPKFRDATPPLPDPMTFRVEIPKPPPKPLPSRETVGPESLPVYSKVELGYPPAPHVDLADIVTPRPVLRYAYISEPDRPKK